MTTFKQVAATLALALMLPWMTGSALAQGDWDTNGDFDSQDLDPIDKEDDGGDWTTGDWNDDGDASSSGWDEEEGETSTPKQDYGDNPNPRGGNNMNR